jgi:hypothetical protein
MRKGRIRSLKIENAERRDDVVASIEERQRRRRRDDLDQGKDLLEIDTSGHFAYESCASVGEFGERRGIDESEVRTLIAVAKAVKDDPEMEADVVSGKLSLRRAAALSILRENPDLLREGDHWREWAEQWTAGKLERELRKRAKEQETGEPTSVLTSVLTCSGREKFEKARQIACEKENKLLDEGATIEVLSDHYLECFDPDRRMPRARRMPDTTGRAGRHRPAEVDRELRARSGGYCQVPGCHRRIWIQAAHIKAHRQGGCREAWNHLRLCFMHHALFDYGFMKCEGTATDPIFRTMDGRIIGGPSKPGGNGSDRSRAPPE